jgi:hypothetical protein
LATASFFWPANATVIFSLGSGPAPDRQGCALLQNHVIAEDMRQAHGGLRGKGQQAQASQCGEMKTLHVLPLCVGWNACSNVYD